MHPVRRGLTRGLALVALATAFLGLNPNHAQAQTTYRWNVAGTGAYNSSTNWTPTRSAPAATDILVIDGAFTPTPTLTTVITQTIGQLSVRNGAAVILQGSASPTLTLAGGAGTDLDIQAGTSVTISGATILIVNVATGATGVISGALTMAGAAHRLTAADPGGILFASGGSATSSTGFSGNMFGTTSLNSVIFQAGSTYVFNTGANPFGAANPNAVAVFQAGSLYRHKAVATPSFSGRTYADFELDNATPATVISATGASALNIDNITILSGSLKFAMTGPFNIKGNVTVNGAAANTLSFNPATAAAITFAGTSPQSVGSGGGTLTFVAGERVRVNNPAGVTITSALTLPDSVTVNAGGLLVAAAAVTNSGPTVVNGTLQVTTGGSVNGAPVYGPAALLRYAGGGTLARGAEWSATSGAGYPTHVRVGGGTTLALSNGAPGTARQAAGNLAVDAGSTFSLAAGGDMTAPVSIRGDIDCAGTLELSGSAGGNLALGGQWTLTGTLAAHGRAVTFDGTAAQTLTGATTFDDLVLNNAAGLLLNDDATVNGALTFGTGRITTGANAVRIGPLGTVSGAGPAAWVNGRLEKPVTVSAGAFAQSFEVGDATTYAPVSIASDAPAPGPSGRVTASTTAGDHPQIGSSTIDATKSANRFWTLSNSGLGFASCQATFNFANPGDLDGGANPAAFGVERYAGGSWFATGAGAATSTSTTATGLTAFGDFQAGESSGIHWTIIATAGAQGAIAPAGATAVLEGGSQAYAITPDACWHVADVLVDGVSVGAVTTYTFTNVTADHTIAASFAADTFTITTTTGGVDPVSATVDCGDDATFSITPPPCHHIADVAVDGQSVGPVTSYTFTNVTADHKIGAAFVVDSYTITATAGPGGTISPAGSVAVNCGADQAFTITPGTCSAIEDVRVDGVSVGPVAGYTFTNVGAAHTISVTFTGSTYTLAATAGPGGSISPAGNVVVGCGTDQAFSIAADPCYGIADVLVDGVSVGPVSTYTFTNVTANHTIAASFAQTTYTITATAGAGGAISPAGAVSVGCGGTQGFTVTPDACHTVANVLVDGVSVGAVTGYTFSGVVANHTIAASFNLKTFTIAASAGAGGSISPGGAVVVGCGANQAFSITPGGGFSVLDVKVDGVSVGAVTSYTFLAVAASHTIAATFKDTQCPAVAVTAPNGGEVLVLGAAYNITWTATDNVAVSCVDVQLSTAGPGGPFTPLATCVANSGTFAWTVTGAASTNAFIKVVARDAATNSCFDVSDAPFVITAQSAVNFLPAGVARPTLLQNRPNPFNPTTRIGFGLPEPGHARLTIYALTGQVVRHLADGEFPAGYSEIEWDGRTDAGVTAASGLYFYRFEAGAVVETKRLVMSK